jgi:chromosome segregation ATPase
LTVEREKNLVHEREQQQLRQQLQQVNEQTNQLDENIKRISKTNEQLEHDINEFTGQNHLLETKLFETMTLVDLRNKTLIDYEQQIEKIQVELVQKHRELSDKQRQIDELEQIVIEKTGHVAQLSETLETGLIKSQHRDKFVEDNANKASNEINALQHEVNFHEETIE